MRSTRNSRSTVTTANNSTTTAKASRFTTSTYSNPTTATATMSPASATVRRNALSWGGQRGHDHAPNRSHGGCDRRLPVAQLAQLQLAAQLKAHHQEEQCHQAVIDPVAQIL